MNSQGHDEDAVLAEGVYIARSDPFHNQTVAMYRSSYPVEKVLLWGVAPSKHNLHRRNVILFPVLIVAHLVLAIVTRFSPKKHVKSQN